MRQAKQPGCIRGALGQIGVKEVEVDVVMATSNAWQFVLEPAIRPVQRDQRFCAVETQMQMIAHSPHCQQGCAQQQD